MRISELINYLNEVKNTDGDLLVCVGNEEMVMEMPISKRESYVAEGNNEAYAGVAYIPAMPRHLYLVPMSYAEYLDA